MPMVFVQWGMAAPGAVRLSEDQVVEHIRDFLSMVDPETDYIDQGDAAVTGRPDT